jgi:hypothetical protein
MDNCCRIHDGRTNSLAARHAHHEWSLSYESGLCLPSRDRRFKPAFFPRRPCVCRHLADRRACADRRCVGRRRAFHAHGHRRSPPSRFSIRRSDRARWHGHRAGPQFGPLDRRPDRAWGDGGDPALSCRSRQCGAARQHALHLRRALSDVYGRHPLVSYGASGFAASIAQLATKINQIMVSSAELAAKAPFAPISITGGVLADEAMALFVK